MALPRFPLTLALFVAVCVAACSAHVPAPIWKSGFKQDCITKDIQLQRQITVGSAIPNVKLVTHDVHSNTNVAFETEQRFTGKRVMIIGMVGAYTPTCARAFVRPYDRHAKELRRSFGIDEILIVSTDDVFTLTSLFTNSIILNDVDVHSYVPAADAQRDFVEALGLVEDRRSDGLGFRAKRFIMVVDSNEVAYLRTDDGGKVTFTHVEVVMPELASSFAPGSPRHEKWWKNTKSEL